MKDREHRGVSLGTVLMLMVTVLVLVVSASILPKLMGSADIRIDTASVLSALNLTEALPELSLSDIPITDVTAVPDMTASPEPLATPDPTAVQPTASPTPVPGGRVTLTFGGSVNVDDNIRKSAYYSDSDKYDFTEILSLLRDEMQSDLTYVTLENIAHADSKVSTLNAPEAVMDMLADHGVDVLSLGFSKAYDKGREAFLATIEVAQARGMTTIGAYASQEDADTLRIITIDNVDVALLHYTESISTASKKGMKADETSYMLPTTLVDGEPTGVLADVQRAKDSGADIVIVSLNWSGTSSFKVSNKLKAFAQQLADAGVDVIVGAGTKAVQEVTWLTSKQADGSIRQTLCAWSLGSLINGERNDGNVAGMLLQLQLAYDGGKVNFERVSYTPTYIWRYKQDNQYQYRVVASDQPAPDGMSDDHVQYMAKALKNIQKVLNGSPVTLRVK